MEKSEKTKKEVEQTNLVDEDSTIAEMEEKKRNEMAIVYATVSRYLSSFAPVISPASCCDGGNASKGEDVRGEGDRATS